MLGLGKLIQAWKHRNEVAAVVSVVDRIKEAPMDARPVWKIGRRWGGLGLIFTTIGLIVSGALPVTAALTNPDTLAAIAAVVGGIIQMLAARGQSRTEKLIADNTAKTEETMKAVEKIACEKKP